MKDAAAIAKGLTEAQMSKVERLLKSPRARRLRTLLQATPPHQEPHDDE